MLDSCIAVLKGKAEEICDHRLSLGLEGMAVVGIHLRDKIDGIATQTACTYIQYLKTVIVSLRCLLELFRQNVTDSSYEWQQQFQHQLVPPVYKRRGTHLSYEIQLFDHTFDYSYEYMGPWKRIIMTPLTERCFHSLALAASTYRCGAVMGASTTGRTSLIQELSYVSVFQSIP